tara:strand:- start:5009 stop:5344 length:336 start_codon:yes stop_codon:yes gene_type:complete
LVAPKKVAEIGDRSSQNYGYKVGRINSKKSSKDVGLPIGMTVFRKRVVDTKTANEKEKKDGIPQKRGGYGQPCNGPLERGVAFGEVGDFPPSHPQVYPDVIEQDSQAGKPS